MAPTPFPEDAAENIVDHARNTGQEAAIGLIDQIRDWLGHPEVVMERAETWDPDVKTIINDSDDSLITARADLEAYWEGPAFDSFKTYITHLEAVIDSTSAITAEFSNLLQGSRDTITSTYAAAVRFIDNCAADIVEATGGIIEALSPLALIAAVFDVIAAFIRNVTDLKVEAMRIMTEYGTLGLDLKQQVADLEIPSPLPSSAAEIENWTPRSRS